MQAFDLGKSVLRQMWAKVDKGSDDPWADGPKIVDDREKRGGRLHEAAERFRAAREDGDRRYDAAMRLATERGRMALGSVVVSIAMGVGWYLQAQKASIETVFIPFDRMGDPGEVFVARPEEPPILMKVAKAESIVKAMFAISSDGNVNSDYQNERDATLRGDAVKRWTDWHNETVDQATERQVLIVSSAQKSPNVINVIWNEVDWRDGRAAIPRRLSGDFTLEYIAPKTAGQIVLNKSGLFLTHMMFAAERR